MTDRSEHPDGEGRGYAAFSGAARIAHGGLAHVALAAKRKSVEDPDASVIVFDRETGAVTDLDLRGDEQVVAARCAPAPAAPARGRPKLGVVAREVTLLPRHWDWLAKQPGGASVTLRRLVDAARKADGGATDARRRVEAAYRFMSAMAGNRPRFEDASRALFAGDRKAFAAATLSWPADIRDELAGFLETGKDGG